MAAVARARPDGYTLLVVSSSFVANPSLYARVPFDAVKDFEPITLAALTPNILVVHPSFPTRDVRQGTDRPCEGQSGEIQLRLQRSRDGAASDGRNSESFARPRSRPRPVQWIEPCHPVRSGRTHAHRIDGDTSSRRSGARRQAAGVGRDDAGRPPRCPMCRR